MNETQISRITRSKENAKASYNRMSRWYDLFASFESAYRNAGLRMLGVREGERVLEIGYGTGQSILALAQSVGASGKVYGIDLSEGMRHIAQVRVNAAGLASRVNLQCGDATNLPFENDCFDAAFISFTLELFDTPEIPIVLSECRRTLRHRGRIGVVAISKRARSSWTMRLYEWAHSALPSIVDCRPIFVKVALQVAGFQLVKATEISMWGIPVAIVLATKAEKGV